MIIFYIYHLISCYVPFELKTLLSFINDMFSAFVDSMTAPFSTLTFESLLEANFEEIVFETDYC